MKILIILMSVMTITGITMANGPSRDSGHGKRYKSKQCNQNREALQKHIRNCYRKNMTSKGAKQCNQNREALQKHIRNYRKNMTSKGAKQCDQNREALQKHIRNYRKNMTSEGAKQRDQNGEALQKHIRNYYRKNMTSKEAKQREEKFRTRLRRMANGNEAEYNRLVELRNNDMKAFVAEMRERMVQMEKNQK